MNLQNQAKVISDDVHPRMAGVNWNLVFNVVMTVLPIALKCLPLLALAGEAPKATANRLSTNSVAHNRLTRRIWHAAHRQGWADVTDDQVEDIAASIITQGRAVDPETLAVCSIEAQSL